MIVESAKQCFFKGPELLLHRQNPDIGTKTQIGSLADFKLRLNPYFLGTFHNLSIFGEVKGFPVLGLSQPAIEEVRWKTLHYRVCQAVFIDHITKHFSQKGRNKMHEQILKTHFY